MIGQLLGFVKYINPVKESRYGSAARCRGTPLIELILLSIAFTIFVGVRFAQDRLFHGRDRRRP